MQFTKVSYTMLLSNKPVGFPGLITTIALGLQCFRASVIDRSNSFTSKPQFLDSSK